MAVKRKPAVKKAVVKPVAAKPKAAKPKAAAKVLTDVEIGAVAMKAAYKSGMSLKEALDACGSVGAQQDKGAIAVYKELSA